MRFYHVRRRWAPPLAPLHKISHASTRRTLLERAAGDNGFFPGLPINCEGGVGHHDRDVQWLLRRRYIRITRIAYGTVWAWDLPVGKRAALRRTRGVITDEGRAALQAGRL